MNEDALARIKEQGVDCVELFFASRCEYVAPYFDAIAEAAKGLEVWSIHAMKPSEPSHLNCESNVSTSNSAPSDSAKCLMASMDPMSFIVTRCASSMKNTDSLEDLMISMIWFMIGGIIDMKQMFRDLSARTQFNDLDNGMVEGNVSLSDKAAFEKLEQGNNKNTKSNRQE